YFGLKEQEGFFNPLPCKLYADSPPAPLLERGEEYALFSHDKVDETNSNSSPLSKRGGRGESVFVILNGVDHNRDLIGCEAAAVTTQVAIQRLQPDLVISCGTCGGWQRYGARVGQTYIADGVMFHDRRVPGDNEWDTQGLGNYKVWEGSWRIAEALGLPMGKVTTGSSFDLSPEEDALIDANGGRLKEMEGAAVAFVCSLYKVPVMLVKAVTNLRDAEEENIDSFQENLKRASLSLRETLVKIINLC
ncbi:MAG: hypothetical protein II055_02555, partial [Prevotella sp.]|nr:hypothetical protein [Prevotella sp.]